MPELEIIYRNTGDLKPSPGNPRTHSNKQIGQIARSIKEFGFNNAVLIDNSDRIIAGHGRVEAAKRLGLQTIPTVSVGHLGPAQIRAYVIADNKLAENAGWDQALLTLELRELSFNLDFDVTLTGFETAELDILLAADANTSNDADTVPQSDRSKPAVSRAGDIWRIGNHLILCGDATNAECYSRLLGNERARMVFTDPPYNVRIAGNVSGLGKAQHDEFQMASGEMSGPEFTNFLLSVFSNLLEFSMDGSLHYICMDWRHLTELLAAAKPYQELKNLCIWNKTNGGMGSLYRSQHELIFVFKNGDKPHINNVELGKHGRNRTNVWTYPGVNAFSADRDAELALHPTVKPVALVADAILDASNRNDVILDAFGGSGTTLLAAEQTGRRGRAIEIDPYYVDTIVRRVSETLKTEACLARSNETFKEVSGWRRSGLE